jgi:drug/metabolite transporter (DMT)-like permease
VKFQSWPAFQGGTLAVGSAALFGVATPLIQVAGNGVGPLTTAALLYAGAASVGAFSTRPASIEARLNRRDLTAIGMIAFFGAVVGPTCLAWGLQRTSASGASLLLTLEAVFTALLAWMIHGETMDRRVKSALGLLTAGAALLVLEQGYAAEGSLWGLLAVLLATAAWGVDNTVSRSVADRDPSQVVMTKSLLGCMATSILAFVAGEPSPTASQAISLLAIGASAFGLSLRAYLLAQRLIGAARTGSIYAFAPLIGVALSVALGDRTLGWLAALGGALMAIGVVLHLTEQHAHDHFHEPVEHEHAHQHEDGHHDHDHSPDELPKGGESHSHWHRHAAARHSHPHTPDLHHQHKH